MPHTVTRAVSVNINGVAFNVNQSLTPDNILGDVNKSGVNAIPGVKAGTLTVRTNDTVGTITLNPGHGLVTGRIDLYWTGGKRRGVTGTVTGDSLAITGGAGDNLPALNSAINAVNPVSETFNVNGAALTVLCVSGPAGLRSQVVFAEANDTSVLFVDLTTTVYNYEWVSGSGVTNPYGAGVSTKVWLSHESASAQDLRAMALGS